MRLPTPINQFKHTGEQARRFRVDSVPFFIVNGEIQLSGAQPPEVILEAFRQAVGPL